MRFGLDEDREALRVTARALLQELCSPAAVRAAWAQPPDRDVWSALAELGALGVLVPEVDGGLGLDETYLTPVVEEAGGAALPHPLTATAFVAAPLGLTGLMVATNLGAVGPTLAACGAGADVFSHTDPAAGAFTESRGNPAAGAGAESRGNFAAGAGAESAGIFSGSDAELHEESVLGADFDPLVPSAAIAEAFLLVGEASELRLYEPHEVELAPVETVDRSRHCARARRVGAGQVVTDDREAVAAAFDRGVLGTAAELLGLSRTMLALAVSHVSERQQFGKPVGGFQAIKHHLANARLQIEFAAPAVLYAAYATAHRLPEARRDVSQAKYLADQAVAVTGRCALQCHGAMGYTVEHDLHLYLKRSWALRRTWGDSRFHADRVASALGLSSAVAQG